MVAKSELVCKKLAVDYSSIRASCVLTVQVFLLFFVYNLACPERTLGELLAKEQGSVEMLSSARYAIKSAAID